MARLARWTPELSDGKFVDLEVVESMSTETVRRSRENETRPLQRKMWRVAPQESANFARNMERALKTCCREFAAALACLDETSKRQTRETRTPLPTLPGKPAGCDCGHERIDTANPLTPRCRDGVM